MSPTDVHEALEAAANERIRDHERAEAKYNLQVSAIWVDWRAKNGGDE